MRKILFLFIILTIPLSGNTAENGLILDKSIPLESHEIYGDFESVDIDENIEVDHFSLSDKCSFRNSKKMNVCVVGGMILGAFILGASTKKRESNCDGTEEHCVDFPKVDYYGSMIGRVLIGIPIGGLAGAGLTFAFDSNRKSALISKSFQF